MEEGVKNKFILILTILTIIFFISSISSCLDNRRQRADRDKEMAQRMDLEEKMTNVSAESAKLEKKIEDLNRLIEEEKAAHGKTQEALSKEQELNKTLIDELDKMTKLKGALEEDLKDALVTPSNKK